MNNDIEAWPVPRRVMLPIVFAVSASAIMLAGGGLGIRPWFVKSFDWLDARGVGHADIDILFRHVGELAGITLLVLPPLAGALLLLHPAQPAARIAWYCSTFTVALAGWCAWLGLVVHNAHIALFER